MCLVENPLWVFQFKNSILSKVVGPTKFCEKDKEKVKQMYFILIATILLDMINWFNNFNLLQEYI